MKSVIAVALAASASACSEPAFEGLTGESHRFVVDRIALPLTAVDARAFGIDLNGDRTVDNQAGLLFAVMADQGDVTTHGADMIAVGALASTVEILADDLADDPSVAVSYFGADGDQPAAVHGRFEAGVFRVTERGAGAAQVRLPFLADIDPITVDVDGLQLELTADGNGGFEGKVAGGIIDPEAKHVAAVAVAKMAMANPQAHLWLANEFDKMPIDGIVTREEALGWEYFAALVAPDIRVHEQVYDANVPALSLGYLIHLTPCDAGRCAPPATGSCFDRVRGGDEADIDCGGTCALACPATAQCREAADCQSKSCDGGTCRAATCSDGVRDGFEHGVDCGGNCRPC